MKVGQACETLSKPGKLLFYNSTRFYNCTKQHHTLLTFAMDWISCCATPSANAGAAANSARWLKRDGAGVPLHSNVKHKYHVEKSHQVNSSNQQDCTYCWIASGSMTNQYRYWRFRSLNVVVSASGLHNAQLHPRDSGSATSVPCCPGICNKT